LNGRLGKIFILSLHCYSAKGLIMRILLLTAILTVALVVHADNYEHIGKGCTTAYYIDEDCDGYGVGHGYVLGADADDNDSTVNTPQSVEQKYGNIAILNNLKSYMQARSYHWDNTVNDVYYISPDGDDNIGVKNNITKPFATFAIVKSLLSPGDVVLYREGTYTHSINCQYGGINGQESAPIIVMSYPGELASFNRAGVINVFDNSWWVFDNLYLYVSGNYGNMIDAHLIHDIDFRNMEAKGGSVPFKMMQDNHNILCEDSIFHDNGMSHAVYWGARDLPNSNLTFKNNIIYNGSGIEYTTAFQHNGACSNLVIDRNIIHSSGSTGVCLMNGVDNSSVINNLIFNNNKHAIIILRSISGGSEGLYGQDHDNDNNQIFNNHAWAGNYENENGEGYPPYSTIRFVNEYNDDAFENNIIKNNIFVAYNDGVFKFDETSHITSLTCENNLIIRVNDSSNIVTHPNGTWTLEEFESQSDNIGNNLGQEPQFTDVSVNYNLNPENFNFNLTSTSPAINFGTPTGAPLCDLRGNERSGNPDAGCYEYQSQYHSADSDEDGNVSTSELKSYIWLWKGGIVSISSMSSAIFEWKTG